MNTANIERYLESFGKQVVKDSRELLREDKGDTTLGNSIRFTVTAEKGGFSTKFYMAQYGQFLDKGVSGNKTKQSYINYDGKKVKSPGKGYTTKGPPIDILSKWIKRKGIKPKGLGRGRSKNTGQFVSGFAFLISRKIKREGIKSLSFFQKPLGLQFKKLEKDMLKILTLDIKSYLTEFYRPK
tara:strand:- start:44 stop:592 length:549 start_codon:yes stop_codon:yes gene_type:complete